MGLGGLGGEVEVRRLILASSDSRSLIKSSSKARPRLPYILSVDVLNLSGLSLP